MSHTLKLATAAPSVESRTPAVRLPEAQQACPEQLAGTAVLRDFHQLAAADGGPRLRAWEVDGRVVVMTSRGWAPLTEARVEYSRRWSSGLSRRARWTSVLTRWSKAA